MNQDRAFAVAPPTPGEVLRGLMETEVDVTQDMLARALGVSRFSVNQILNGRRNVTAAMALRLAKALSTSPSFWLNLQQRADLFAAQQELASELKSVRVLRKARSDEELFLRE